MANKTINDLTAGVAVDGTEVLPAWQAGQTVKLILNNVVGLDTRSISVTAIGSSQSTATGLVSTQNYVSNGVDGTNSVRINASLMVPLRRLFVINEDPTNFLPCFPDVGVTIDNQTVNTRILIPPNTCQQFLVKTATALRTVQ